MPEPSDIQDLLDEALPREIIDANNVVVRALLPTSAEKAALGDIGDPADQAANTFLAGPETGADAPPAYRIIAVDDVPELPQSKITSLAAALLARELLTNKSLDVDADSGSTDKYPAIVAVEAFVQDAIDAIDASTILNFTQAVRDAVENSLGAPVADLVALRAIAPADRQDKQIRFVEGVGDHGFIYAFNAEGTDVDDDDGIIQPDSGTGRWFKRGDAAGGVTDHGGLTGLGDDDHAQYPLMAGRSGNQGLIGGTLSGGYLELVSTAHAVKGLIKLGLYSAYDELNKRLGIGTLTPDFDVEVVHDGAASLAAATSYGASARFLGRSAGGSKAAPTQSLAGALLAIFGGVGYGATGFGVSSSGRMKIMAAADHTDTSHPGQIIFETVPVGSVTPVERVKIDETGELSVAGSPVELTSRKSSDISADTGSTTKYPSVAAVEAYVALKVAGLLDLKSGTDCSANPNYPAASKGDAYYVTVDGKIGGAAGKTVEAGDVYFATADNAGGTEASVGASWQVIEHNLQLVIGTTVQAWSAALDEWATKARPTGAVAGLTDAQTFTNKRNTKRVYTNTSVATLTPEIDTYDLFHLTAQAAALTIANHSTSTPTDGEQMKIRLLDNGTARALTFGTNYVAKAGVALPTTTVISKNMEMLFEWNGNLSKWNLMAIGQEA